MKIELMEDFYIEELKDTLDAEKQLLKALPQMARAAVSPELKAAFELHLQQTQEQIARLQKIFKRLQEPTRGKKCKAMAGLIREGQEFLGEDAVEEIIDVGLITIAQKIEHYEIAAYGCLATYAKILGFMEDKELLGQTLQEEKSTDGKLTMLAESINLEAAEGESPLLAAEEERESAAANGEIADDQMDDQVQPRGQATSQRN
jgi:ferritin-like metal-binding protein YciE